MQALFVNTVSGEKILNLGVVTVIEFDGGDVSTPSLDFWFSGVQAPERFMFHKSVKQDEVFRRLREALKPMYDGRMQQVLGVEMRLNIADLQVREEVF
jgi:hypothetical protein